MVNDRPEDATRDVVAFIMAKGEMDRIQAYVDRGRKLERLSDDKLRELMVPAYKAWAANVSDPMAGELTNDIGAEFASVSIEKPDNEGTLVRRHVAIGNLSVHDRDCHRQILGLRNFRQIEGYPRTLSCRPHTIKDRPRGNGIALLGLIDHGLDDGLNLSLG
jgi:hypothetical protein